MRPVIFYREFDISEFTGELEAAQEHFRCVPQRTQLECGDLAICRYSALPFYKELEQDLNIIGASMINSYKQHRYIADLQNWYFDLIEFTPKTWFEAAQVPMNEPGSFVLKGETNSKKFQWRTHMFAETREDIVGVMVNLMNDGLVGQQNIYVRRFVELKTYMIGPQDMPITDEYRFFICDGNILSGAYYWSSHVGDFEDLGISVPDVSNVPNEFLEKVIERVGDSARFWVLDVGQTKDGEWIVIELNDGQMSGLSENNPTVMYSNLHRTLTQ